MNDDQELVIAKWLLELARDCAGVTSKKQDVEAATAAILMRALELATPDLSAEQRARLFQGEE